MTMNHSLKALTLVTAMLSMGCGSSDVNFIPQGPNPPAPLQPPIAQNDTFQVLGNSNLQVPAPGVLANDTPNGASISLQTAPTLGNVTFGADGSFTYAPNPGVTNQVDTFLYRLNNAAGSATATVTLNIGAIGAFVNNAAGPGGNGSEVSPFQTLAQAVAANGANPVTFVLFQGSGPYSESVTLQAGQRLQSRSGELATLTGSVSLTQNNQVTDLRIFNTVGTAINGTSAVNGTLARLEINGASQFAVAMINATGTWSATDCNVSNTGGAAFNGSADIGVLNWSVSNCVFADNNGTDAGGIYGGTASQNITVNNCVSNRSEELVFIRGNGSGTIALNVSNNRVEGGGVSLRGIDIQTQGTTQLAAVITGNNITGCTQAGIDLFHFGSSFTRYRFEENRLLNNGPGGFVSGTDDNADLGVLLRNNVSNTFGFTQFGASAYKVGNFSQLNTALGNSGTNSTTGTIQDVDPATLGVP